MQKLLRSWFQELSVALWWSVSPPISEELLSLLTHRNRILTINGHLCPRPRYFLIPAAGFLFFLFHRDVYIVLKHGFIFFLILTNSSKNAFLSIKSTKFNRRAQLTDIPFRAYIYKCLSSFLACPWAGNEPNPVCISKRCFGVIYSNTLTVSKHIFTQNTNIWCTMPHTFYFLLQKMYSYIP